MNLTKIALLASIIVSSSFNLYAQESKGNVDLSKFRFSYEEMQQIANAKLLSHRIFYEKPSVGPDAAWFDAVKQGNLATIKKMVEAGQNLEAKDEASLGQTALGWAAFIGYFDIVKYLTEQGADIRATDKADVYNTVKSAVMGKNAEVVKYLHERLKNEVDWNAKEQDGETLFMVAAVDGRLDVVKYILQFNPDLNVVAVNEEPKINASPLSGACENGFTDVANLLIEKGAINHKTGKSSCD
ncbi:ankyrin [Chania multitudinisentens RB-25]|uniref:Ankyrin n=1 Tax=Chania multitudinisentens RB-25 TaxID=1441930 RepID=W0L801_9GAMM|nr:ankyrin repeat domain-containing protein [Chania multitudinisentens]AHG19938.1 ankyrin [Chania multitudinisentens RB-25]